MFAANLRFAPRCLILTFLTSGVDTVNADDISRTDLPHPLNLVDPLIGTAHGGHVFPGASLPFGMAKAGADVNYENQGGYSTDGTPDVPFDPAYPTEGNITGFSHMHDSGTGGSPSLGNFPLFPIASCPDDNDINTCAFPISARAVPRVNGSAVAHPGYFAVSMVSGVRAEMTVTNHTALYRFTFNQTSTTNSSSNETAGGSPLILVDLTDLPKTRVNGSVGVNATSGRMTGSGVFGPSFGVGNYALHFCADFSGAEIRDAGVWKNTRAGTDPTNLTVVQDGVDSGDDLTPAGAWTRFVAPTRISSYGDSQSASQEILARVGVSFISVDQACMNAETEVPTFDFNRVHCDAVAAWSTALSPLTISPGNGTSLDLQKTFWSGLYRTMLSPQDYTGENPLWTSSEPYYDSYYCIWDSFRSIHPLLTLVAPTQQIRMLRSLVDIYRHEGWLPDCRMSLCKGFTQGGSNADVVLADAYVKFAALAAEGGVQWETAYEALVKDAEVEPQNWDVEGRGGLRSWKGLGFIPEEDFDPDGTGTMTRSVSRTVEYAYDDFCIAEVAKGLSRTEDYTKYLERSGNWRNLWKADQNSSINGTSTGFTGFLQPRYSNQTWSYQDPIFCSPLFNFTSCYLNPDGHETYEGSAWLYSFFAPHEMSSLTPYLGGSADAVRRLDYLHDSGILYIGDEQAFLPVFQYHYFGRPGLSGSRARMYIPEQFNATNPAGLPGNDDSGAMGAFAALAMLGVFPNPGQDVYFLTPPFFQSWSLRNELTAKIASVITVGVDGAMAGQGESFIQSVKLNGEVYTRNWIGHSFFLDGGTLELTLGPKESAWGTGEEDLPPSVVRD